MVRAAASRPTALAGVDRATLRRAQAGEPDAITVFVQAHERAVWSLVWRMLGRRADQAVAEDVTQDAFMRILSSLDRFDPDGSARLATWVLTIAARATIDALRRMPVRVVSADTLILRAPSADSPELQGHRRDLGRVIASAVDGLSPEIRATFLLRAYHDLDYEEIAHALEVDLGTVKSRLWRARKQLRERLSEVNRDA